MRAFGSVLFLVLLGSSVSGSSDLIPAEAGDDVILPCEAPNINEILVLEWIRSDLQENEYVFFYRDKRVDLAGQHESFKNRVFLLDDQMKDGDLSVVLKNLKIEDTGTYECKVLQEDDPQTDLKLISSIRLMVIPPLPLPPPPPPPPPCPGNIRGEIWGFLALIPVLGLIVAVAVHWRRINKERSKLRSVIFIKSSDDIETKIKSIKEQLRKKPDWEIEVLVFPSVSETNSEIEEKIKKSLSMKTMSSKIRVGRLTYESLETLRLLVNELQQPSEDLLHQSKAGCS